MANWLKRKWREWVGGVQIADDNSLGSRIGELGWQIHNLGCEHQNDEDLSGRLQELRGMAWELADRARAAERGRSWLIRR